MQSMMIRLMRFVMLFMNINAKHDDKVDALCYAIHEYLIEESNPHIA